jgi:hypothetical protein
MAIQNYRLNYSAIHNDSTDLRWALVSSSVSLILSYTDGTSPWTGDQPVASPLPTHRTTQARNKRT